METIGWIGSICFALCAIPQAWKSFKDGHSRGITWGLMQSAQSLIKLTHSRYKSPILDTEK